jgi:hypothetical protein
MINYFYTIFKKDSGSTDYMFLSTFSAFMFFSVFSVVGLFTTLIYLLVNLFYEFDYSLLLIFNLSISIVFPMMRIFYPGYIKHPKVENYSKSKVGFIFYISFFTSFALFLFYLQIISWILFPESNFSVLHWHR